MIIIREESGDQLFKVNKALAEIKNEESKTARQIKSFVKLELRRL